MIYKAKSIQKQKNDPIFAFCAPSAPENFPQIWWKILTPRFGEKFWTLKPSHAHQCIRSQIQILIRYNFFQTEYFLLKFSGSLELFLKRSIPVSFCSKKLYLVTRNCRNFKIFRKKIAYARKNYLTHPQYIFWTKRHRIRASHREIWRFWKFEQKILSLKKVRAIFRLGEGGSGFPPITP